MPHQTDLLPEWGVSRNHSIHPVCPGRLVARIATDNPSELTPEGLVEGALDVLSLTDVSEKTQSALIEFAEAQLSEMNRSSDSESKSRQHIANVLRLAGATPEFQRA